MGIPREMSRYPVEDNSDPLPVQMIHKGPKIIRGTIAARRCIIAGNLIAPRGVQRMLHNGKKLNMSVTHILYIFRKLFGNLPVIVKLASVDFFSVFIKRNRLLHP